MKEQVLVVEYDYSNEPQRDILCVDLKSFYASVECVSRGLDPLTTLLIVMSNAESGGGLALAASPMAKSELGITNVTRKYEIPDDPRLLIVPPRMTFYIAENMKINEIFRRYVSDSDLHIYSIDESFLDVTASLTLFETDAYGIARMIQLDIYHELGLYCTIGIGDNPLLAKLALDNAAKTSPDMKAEWRYQDVPETIWKIPNLTDMWGIGSRTVKRLNRYGIYTVYDLAHTHPALMKERFGLMGSQLAAHAWGIDRSRLNQKFTPVEKSYGNSQVLMRDYQDQKEIEIVIREIAEQVATRIRRQGCQTACVSLGIGYSRDETQSGFSCQKAITATANSKILRQHCLELFRKHYDHQVVRHISISYSKLVYHTNHQLNLFEDPTEQIAHGKIDTAMDLIRSKYGFTSIFRTSSLLEGATALHRSTLVGGHAGGTDGID